MRKTIIALAAALVAAGSMANAQVTTVFSEDFESYSTISDMLVANGGKWSVATFGSISTAQAHGGTKSLFSPYTEITGAAANASFTVARGGVQDSETTSVIATYWVYDGNAPSGVARRGMGFAAYGGGSWGSGTLRNYIYHGLYTSTNAGTYNRRVVSGGAGWVAGTVARTAGWHEMKTVLGGAGTINGVAFFVDGAANGTDTFSVPPNIGVSPDTGWNCLTIRNISGANDTAYTTSDHYFDDIKIEADPSVPVSVSGIWID